MLGEQLLVAPGERTALPVMVQNARQVHAVDAQKFRRFGHRQAGGYTFWIVLLGMRLA